MKELISDESPTWDKKTKKNVKQFFLEHGLIGQLYEDRAKELKESENDYNEK